MNSEVRKVRTQRLDAPSCEWQSHKRIKTVHPRRTGGRDPGISRTRGSQGKNPKVGCSKSRVVKPRKDQDCPSEEDRWQRSRDLANSGFAR
jgi:hypothetical protein